MGRKEVDPGGSEDLFEFGHFWASPTTTPEPLSGLGGHSTRPRDINRLGQIVGAAQDGSDNFFAVFWADKDATPQKLLGPDGAPAQNSSATGIKDEGQIVGSVAFPDGNRAVFWPTRTRFRSRWAHSADRSARRGPSTSWARSSVTHNFLASSPATQ